MKNILCALTEPNSCLLERIAEFGKEHGWQVEYSDGVIPPGWSGAGVITDHLLLTELSKIDRFESTPVVSRLLPPIGNVRTVRADTTRIAAMIAEYFLGKGFTRFAMTSPRGKGPPEMVDGRPRHIQAALDLAFAERGMELIFPVFNPHFPPEKDYRERTRLLKEFFAGIERPYALILPSSRWLALVYRVLDELGFRVPEEVAVLVNVDSWSVTESAIIPTSCIDGEFRELGSKLVELLERMMAGETVPEKMVYAAGAGVISRRSTDTFAVSDRRLALAVGFLMRNYMNFISIEDAAHEAGVTGRMLVYLFRRELGKTPGRFLRELRMNRIRSLLDGSDLTLAEIARQTGYGSDMALSAAFKQETGVTPGFYRDSRRHL